MSVQITALYAGILALLLTALAINVTVNRNKLKVTLGDGGHAQMLRMARIHGNSIEYVPIGLVLMGLYELYGGLPLALHVTGIVLIVGRLLYAWGMWSTSEPGFGRIAGTSLTWLTIVALAVLNLWQIR
jgi:uncharacterized membrane protein YecN with MAPEG domain